jgi:hypothetical protein
MAPLRPRARASVAGSDRARCKTRCDCRTILSMRATFVRAAAAATFALVLAPATHAQSQETPNTATTVKGDARTAGHAVAHSADAVGHSIAEQSRQAGHAISDGTRSARDAVRDDSKKAGHAIADGARSLSKSVREGAVKVKAAVTGKSHAAEPKS